MHVNGERNAAETNERDTKFFSRNRDLQSAETCRIEQHKLICGTAA